MSWTDDEVHELEIRPHGRRVPPSSSMYSVSIGEVVMTHFTYGIPVELDAGFDIDSRNILVLHHGGWPPPPRACGVARN